MQATKKNVHVVSEEESDGDDPVPSSSVKPATSKKRKLHDVSGSEVSVLNVIYVYNFMHSHC